jgi:peptidoglycan/xylan/chitin deacetylase (PgdA/CDA1 family)
MSVRLRVSGVVLASTLLASGAGAESLESAGAIPGTQYVIISFDGAGPIAQWQRSRALAAKAGAKFTYFLSCVYLVTQAERRIYLAPGKGAGKSNVGFASSAADVGARLEQIWAARSEGHEIASHACGHFDGKDWTRAEWKAEFAQFTALLTSAFRRNGIEGEPAGWRDFAQHDVRGFRAPYLSTGKSLYQALAEKGFAYDASGVSRGPAAVKPDNGVAHFALPQIPEGPSARRVIAMDYNLFVRHSGGFEKADTDAAFETRTYEAFKAAFEAQYRGERIPLQLGFHFTLMNGGAYWRALERFALETCIKPGVVCTSYARYLEAAPPAVEPPAAGLGG